MVSETLHYKLNNLPQYCTHKLLKELIIKHLKLETDMFKIKYRLKSKIAIIESQKEITEEFFMYKNKKINISRTEKRRKTQIVKNKSINDIREIVTPLYEMKYEETVDLKIKELKKDFPKHAIEYTKAERFFRNKFEFAFGYDKHEKTPSLGFRGGKFTIEDANIVFCPLNVIFMPENIKKIVLEIKKLLAKEEYSNLIYRRDTKEGILKMMLLRTDFSETINLISLTAENDRALKFLKELSLSVNNLYYTIDDGVLECMPIGNIYKIEGKDFLIQKVLQNNFKLTFFSFFQTNIKIFEHIITDIKYYLKDKSRNVLLDLCCGTGIIGILLSGIFKRVIGIEINEKCLPDAKDNFIRNKIENYIYHNICIKKLQTIKTEEKENIAILDPPRAGVHKDVIKTIRKNESIKIIIFICCDYKKSMQNLEDLLRPESKAYEKNPFYIEKIKGYDMFPFMKQSETVFYLKRVE